jgi:NAD(P) transhydrogenase
MASKKASKNSQKFDYDLIVLGSGPGGQRAAISASKLHKKILVIEKKQLGGSCLHTGTIPSKTLREAALTCGATEDVFSFVMNRKNHVIREETGIIQEHLERNLIEYTQGTATFLDKNKIKITSGKLEKKVSGKYIIIATGTSPNRPPEIPFDDEKIVDSDSLLTWKKMPQKLLVIGAGVVGLEYASILSCVGVDVTLIDPRENILPWMDSEIVN